MVSTHACFRLLMASAALAALVSVAGIASPPPADSCAPVPGRADESPPAKAALVLIEFQKEWLGDQGKLVRLFDHPSRGQSAARRAKVALEAARAAGLTVIHAPMILSPGYPELGEASYGLRAAIPRAGTWIGEGAQFAEGFEPVEGEPVVLGRVGASAFVQSDLQDILKRHGITRIYLAGFATHVCVESTLRHAHDLAYDVVVLRDACAAFNDEQESYFHEHVVHHFGHAIKVRQFVRSLMADPALRPGNLRPRPSQD